MRSSRPASDRTAEERGAALGRGRLALRWHPWPAAALDVLARLADSGGTALLVGGTVRDALLGRDPACGGVLDVATDRTPEEVMARFARVEPIGLPHGTVLILAGGLEIECTTFRREGAYADARHPDHVEFTHDPIEDLGRRDLTVNAIAFDPLSGWMLDPHGGALDLERGVLRAVGDPLERFHEDALRPLRVARLAATLEMEVEETTRIALGGARDRARWVSWERVRAELEKMMGAREPSRGLELMREAGLLELWLPELERCVGVAQNRHHAYDVYEHSIRTCDAAPPDKPRVRWAALLHDIGKPETRVERRGEGTFYNHQFVGADSAERLLERLRFPLEDRRAIAHLIREHMFDYRPEWTDAGLRRWLRRVGVAAVADLFDLRVADYIGNGLRRGFPSYLDGMRRRIDRLMLESQALSVRDLAVNGHDVMRVLGLAPGPRVGEILEALLEEVIERPRLNRRDLQLAWLAERADEGVATVEKPVRQA
jgi:putative nucleotidyltransferase with HDIG domain